MSATKGKTYSLAVVCTGMRYDVMQHVALAVALRDVGGFRVKLVTHSSFLDLATKYKLPFSPLKGDPSAIMKTSAFRDAVGENSILKIAALLKKESDQTIEVNMTHIHDSCMKGANPVDGIICSIAVLTECLAIGQKYQRPVILAPLLPYSPSGELPLAQMLPEPTKYAWLNKLSYDVSGALLWGYMAQSYNKFRTKVLGIGPQASYELEGVPQITAFSPSVVPPPADWGPWVHVTAHWTISEHPKRVAEANPTLAAMLGNAASLDLLRRPIVVNFEGVPLPDPIGFLRAAHTVAEKMGVPIIFCAGDADVAASMRSPRLAHLPDIVFEMPGMPAVSAASSSTSSSSSASASSAATNGAGISSAAARAIAATPRILVVGHAPYAFLFRHASMAIHQGGAAIAQAAMAAGIPSAAFPAFGEQYFWAARISALSVGPAVHYPLREVAIRLEEIISVARQSVIVTAAAQLGLAMEGGGDGAYNAVMTIRDILNRPQHRHCGVTCTWEPDESRTTCSMCNKAFTLLNRRRHCRSCGRLACTACFNHRCHLPGFAETAPQITCERCLDHRRAYFAMHVGESCVPEMPISAAGLLSSSSSSSSSSTSPGADGMMMTGAGAGGDSVALAAAADAAKLSSPSPMTRNSNNNSNTSHSSSSSLSTPASSSSSASSSSAAGGTPHGPMTGSRNTVTAAAVSADFSPVDLLSRGGGSGGAAAFASPAAKGAVTEEIIF